MQYYYNKCLYDLLDVQTNGKGQRMKTKSLYANGRASLSSICGMQIPRERRGNPVITLRSRCEPIKIDFAFAKKTTAGLPRCSREASTPRNDGLQTSFISVPQIVLRVCIVISLLFFSLSQAEAYRKTVISPGAYDQNVVDAAQKYLHSIKKVAIDIKQTDKHHKVFNGKLLISKPSNFRWNYYAPYPLLIVGNESFVTIYDYEMQQATNIKPDENIFQFLISDAPLGDDFDIIDAYSKNNQYYLLVRHKDFDRRAQLIFSKEPVKLRSLSIIDGDSSHITVEFSNFIPVTKFDNSLFAVKNPEVFGEPKRYDRQEIEKMYNP